MYYVICSGPFGVDKCIECVNIKTARTVRDSLRQIYGEKSVWVTKVVDLTNGKEV